MAGFYGSVNAPRRYRAGGLVKAGVVPHHLAGAALIGGFFEMCAGGGYDAVVVVAPNHAGDIADVVISKRDWDAPGGALDGVPCDAGIADAVSRVEIAGLKIAEDDGRVQADHSASVLMPYIGHYLPGAAVVPVLVSRSMSLDSTLRFADELTRIADASGKRVLLVCSIDFSHFLTPAEAAARDAETLEAVKSRDYGAIQRFSNNNADSPAALNIFLRYAANLRLDVDVVDHADASEMLKADVAETTSYYVLAAGAEESRATLAFAGDLMAHEEYAYGGSFQLIKKYLADADLVAGNLETTLCGGFSGYPRFGAPDAFAEALAGAGFGFVSTANNHCADHPGSVGKTIDALDRAGIGHAGTYKTALEDRIYIKDVNGIKFALLCYTYGVNIQPYAGYVNLLDRGAIKADIRKAGESGADAVVVFAHMGDEYAEAPGADVREWVKIMFESGADAVVGCHPHIVHEMGFYDAAGGGAGVAENAAIDGAGDAVDTGGGAAGSSAGCSDIDAAGDGRRRFAAYSLGNFVSSMTSPPECKKGALLKLTFTKRRGGETVISGASCIYTEVIGAGKTITPKDEIIYQ